MNNFCDDFLKQSGYKNQYFNKHPIIVRWKIWIAATCLLGLIACLCVIIPNAVKWSIFNLLFLFFAIIMILVLGYSLKHLVKTNITIILSRTIDYRLVKKNQAEAMKIVNKRIVSRLARKYKISNERLIDFYIKECELLCQERKVEFSLLKYIPLTIVISVSALLFSISNLFFEVQKYPITAYDLYSLLSSVSCLLGVIFGGYKILKYIAIDVLKSRLIRLQQLIGILNAFKIEYMNCVDDQHRA